VKRRSDWIAGAAMPFLIVAFVVFVETARAAEGKAEAGRIIVDASGTVPLKPDVAEIRASVSGNASVAADAVKKFRDNRRRALKALDDLKLKNLKVDLSGTTVGS
jgi:uncharacterized protein YggE